MSFYWSEYQSNENMLLDQFVRNNGGSFFHQPIFFNYHPNGRFDFFHLVCRQNEKIVAWLPGHKIDNTFFSPPGATYGGPLWMKSLPIEKRIECTNHLKLKLNKLYFERIRFQIPPAFYFGDTSYILSASHFKLSDRLACHALHLAGSDWPEALSKSKRYDYRKAIKANIHISELSFSNLSDFYSLLEQQSKRKQTKPTHNQKEISDLVRLLPGRLRLFGAKSSNQLIAAVLVIIISSKIAYTFYIVSRDFEINPGATLVTITHIAKTLKNEGFHWLDLGPSTESRFRVNTGLAMFKDSLGSILFTRDEWTFSFQINE